jgi:hypothetical protein
MDHTYHDGWVDGLQCRVVVQVCGVSDSRPYEGGVISLMQNVCSQPEVLH